MSGRNIIELLDPEGAEAQVAPELGGWLLRYARRLPGHDRVEALHCSREVVDRHPRQMYAGIPVLFPLVSNNRAGDRDHHYEWEGQLFEMPQHGFARRSRWSIADQSATHVTMELTDDESTRPNYPFAFRQRLTYRLHQGRLHWEQVIENRGDRPMPFSTGFHPYFQVPLSPTSQRSACFVEIPGCKRVSAVGPWERYTVKPFPGQNWSVQEDVSGTMFLTDLESPELVLIDPVAELEVVLNVAGAPQHRFVAIWSRSTDEPFYCLEPWTALPNSFSRTRDHDLIVLEPRKTFRAAMWMEVRPVS
jgi:galactose mutarotase-like enzyme